MNPNTIIVQYVHEFACLGIYYREFFFSSQLHFIGPILYIYTRNVCTNLYNGSDVLIVIVYDGHNFK